MALKTNNPENRDWLVPAGISLIWLMSMLIVNPVGDFPLNDDWAYAKIVKNLLDNHKFFINNWPAMTLLVHIGWGALFAKLFGFSFMVLRFSTIIPALSGIFAGFYLFRMFTMHRFSLILATFLLAFNPYYFSLSVTYMTDVGFTIVLILAAHFFARYLRSDKIIFLAVSVGLCMTSVLIRQIGLLLPMAFIPAILARRKLTAWNIVLSLIPLVLTLSCLELFVAWLKQEQTLPPDFGSTSLILANIFQRFFYFIWGRLGQVLFYLVGLSLPFSLYGFPGLWKSSSKKFRIASAFFIGLMLIFINNKFYSLPIENISFNFGIGPRLLKDVYWDLTKPPKIQRDVQNVMNFLILCTIVPYSMKLLTRLKGIFRAVAGRQPEPENLASLTFFTFILLYSIFLTFNNALFDRYFLPLYPFILAVALPASAISVSKWLKSFSVVLVSLIALYSIIATHDYFAWNRARWNAIHYLMDDKKILPAEIEGGFEFNGWHTVQNQKIKRGTFSPFAKSWWFVDNDRYMVANDILPCYNKMKGFKIESYIPEKHDSIYALKAMPLDVPVKISCDLETLTSDRRFLLSSDYAHVFRYKGTLAYDRQHSGSCSLMIPGGSESGIFINLKDFFPCEKIKVSFWKYPAKGGAGIRIVNKDFSDFDMFEKDYFITSDKNGWVKIETEITIPAGFGKNEIQFGIYSPAGIDCLVDDFEIVRQRPHD